MHGCKINNTFVSYYKTLYKSDSPLDLVNQNSFLNGLIIPCISEGTKTELERELNLNDICNAITNMKGVKPSGPDGLPIDIDKLFKAKSIVPLLDVFLESFKQVASPLSYIVR